MELSWTCTNPVLNLRTSFSWRTIFLSSSLFTCYFHKSKNMPYITHAWFFELSLVGFLIKYLWNDFERFPLLIHSYHLLTLKKIFFLSKPFTAFEVSRFLKTDVKVHMQEETKANKHSQKSVSVDWGLLSGSDASSLRPVTLWLYTQAEGSGKLPSWKEATQRIKGQDLYAAETVGSLALIQNATFWTFFWYMIPMFLLIFKRRNLEEESAWHRSVEQTHWIKSIRKHHLPSNLCCETHW